MARDQAHLNAIRLSKELGKVLPKFIKVSHGYNENRRILNGPQRHFLNFECSTADLKDSYHATIEVAQGTTIQSVMHELIMELMLESYSNGSDSARSDVAAAMLASAGLTNALKG